MFHRQSLALRMLFSSPTFRLAMSILLTNLWARLCIASLRSFLVLVRSRYLLHFWTVTTFFNEGSLSLRNQARLPAYRVVKASLLVLPEVRPLRPTGFSVSTPVRRDTMTPVPVACLHPWSDHLLPHGHISLGTHIHIIHISSSDTLPIRRHNSNAEPRRIRTSGAEVEFA